MQPVLENAVSNLERTRAEKIFGYLDRTIHNFFHARPALDEGLTGWMLRGLGRPFRLYRHTIWNRYAYNRDGRMTTRTALRTLVPTLLGLVALFGAILVAL